MTPFGILGGTFDPIHDGHLGVAAAARAALGLATVQLAPARVPPHRTGPLVSIYHRFAMVAIAAETDATLVACELGLESTEPSYTGALLEEFTRAGHAASQMVFIIGADAFAEIETWRRYPQVLDLAHFVVVSRPGFDVGRIAERIPELRERITVRLHDVVAAARPRVYVLPAATPDVSSTEIRRRLRAGESIAGLVPDLVDAHIRHHRLYLDDSSSGLIHSAADHLHGKD